MAQKNATPTREQQAAMKRGGLKPEWWTVVRDLTYSLIVRNKLTGEFKYIEK